MVDGKILTGWRRVAPVLGLLTVLAACEDEEEGRRGTQSDVADTAGDGGLIDIADEPDTGGGDVSADPGQDPTPDADAVDDPISDASDVAEEIDLPTEDTADLGEEDASGDPDAEPEVGNTAPTANAGPDQLTRVGRWVRLAGSGTDPDAGQTLTYAWTQLSGPSVTLDDATAAAPIFLVRQVGVYELQLVVGDGLEQSDPATVTVTVIDLDGGEAHSLLLEADGTLWAWGADDLGQLGNGEAAAVAEPGRVCDVDAAGACADDPLTGVVAIGAGRYYSLALKADGTVWGWGENGLGQLGSGSDGDSAQLPTQVCAPGQTAPCESFLDDVVAIAAGYEFAAALREDGTVVTWGRNFESQLGSGIPDGTLPWSNVPVHVCASGEFEGPCSAEDNTLLVDVQMITAGGGGHAIVALEDGRLQGWGHNKNGQVGAGHFDAEIPIPVSVCGYENCDGNFADVFVIEAWSGQSFAVTTELELWGWGNNGDSELGLTNDETCNGGEACATTPHLVCMNDTDLCTDPLEDIADVAAGRDSTVAAAADGAVWAWGGNRVGEVGIGVINDSEDVGITPHPVRVCAAGEEAPCDVLLDGVAVVAAGSWHVMAVTGEGQLLTWGENVSGQLGIGEAGPAQPIPQEVSGF